MCLVVSFLAVIILFCSFYMKLLLTFAGSRGRREGEGEDGRENVFDCGTRPHSLGRTCAYFLRSVHMCVYIHNSLNL